MKNNKDFIIGTLEQMVLTLPNDEIRRRFENIGVSNEKIDSFMNCIDNSRKKYETQEEKTSGDSDK